MSSTVADIINDEVIEQTDTFCLYVPDILEISIARLSGF